MKTQYSQKVDDFLGLRGFFILVILLVAQNGSLTYTDSPCVMTPEAIPTQVAPEEPKVTFEIHITV